MNSLSLNNLKKQTNKLSLRAKPIHSRPTLYDPMAAALQAPLSIGPSLWPHGRSPPGSSVRRTLQARTLERAVPSSMGSSWPKDRTCLSGIAGRFFTTESPGKSQSALIYHLFTTFLLILISSGCSNEVSQPEQLKQQTWHSRLWRPKSGVEQGRVLGRALAVSAYLGETTVSNRSYQLQ